MALSAEWQSKHRHVRALAQRASVVRGVNKVTSGGKRHSTSGCSTAGQLGEGVEKQNSLAKRMQMLGRKHRPTAEQGVPLRSGWHTRESSLTFDISAPAAASARARWRARHATGLQVGKARGDEPNL